jgi:tol-pal system protein YbgF
MIAAAGFLLASTASAQTALPPPAYGTADQRQDQIEELQGQLRDATAQNEQLQYQLLQANREITRLRGMVGELAGVNQSLSAAPADPNAAAAPDDGKPPEPGAPGQSALNDAQQRATGTLGTVPAAAVPAPPAPADPAPAYSQARQLLNNGRLAEAEAAFTDFLQVYPNAETAPDARYLLAYTLLARNSYNEAASGFVDYLRRYPNGARAPDAQVRLGMALNGMGQTRQACAAWADVPRRYTRAPQSLRDRAASEARAAHCPA